MIVLLKSDKKHFKFILVVFLVSYIHNLNNNFDKKANEVAKKCDSKQKYKDEACPLYFAYWVVVSEAYR